MAGKIITDDKWFDEASSAVESVIEPLDGEIKRCLEDSMLSMQGYENDSDFICQALRTLASLREEATLILQKIRRYKVSVEYAKKNFAVAEDAARKNASGPYSSGSQGAVLSSTGKSFTGRGGKY